MLRAFEANLVEQGNPPSVPPMQRGRMYYQLKTPLNREGFLLSRISVLCERRFYTDNREMPFLSSVRISRAVSFTR